MNGQIAPSLSSLLTPQLWSVFELAGEGVFLLTTSGHLGKVNAFGCRMLGYTPAELLKLTWRDLLPPEDLALSEPLTELRSGQQALLERRLRGKDGRLLPVEINAQRTDDDHIIAFVRAITEPKPAEGALQPFEDHFAKAFRASPVAMSLSRQDNGRFIDVNDSFLHLFGYSRAEAIGRTSLELRMYPHASERAEMIRQLRQQGALYNYEQTMIAKSGEPRDTLISAEVIDLNGEGHLLAIIVDITARQQMESALREMAENMAAAQRINHFGSWEVNLTADLQPVEPHLWSDECYRIFGLEPGSVPITAELFVSLIHPDDRQVLQQRVNQAIQDYLFLPYEHRIVRPDGSVRTVWEQASVVLDETGRRPIKVVGTVHDITERKQAEAALQTNEKRLSLAVEAAGLGIYENAVPVDAAPYYSDRWAAILGYNLEQLPPPTDRLEWVIKQVHPDDLATLGAAYRAFTAGRTPTFSAEFRLKHQSGEWIWVKNCAKAAAQNEQGQITRILGVIQDITQAKQLQAQLLQAQKMESVGRLAGGVAHDFNNLLTVIQGYASLMEDDLKLDDPLRISLAQIQQAADSAAGLTRQLLAFSRQQMLTPTLLDLNDLVSNLQKMLKRLIGEDILLNIELASAVHPVLADPGQLEQVLLNLTVNARDAMPTGGRLTIETAQVELDEVYLSTHLEAPLGPAVMLAVSDTGYGMDQKTQAKIFDPFFTTKAPGQGTGLGLATVYGIVKQSGGDIHVYSEPGQGTTFKIYLPSAQKAGAPPAAEPAQPELREGNETILLVEDEDQLRSLIQLSLQKRGYTLLTARRGDEAMALVEARPEPIDLLLTDVVMPEMSGRVLAEQLTARQPGLRVLYISGYTNDAVVRHGLLTAEVEFLSKPFSPTALTAKVRQVLDK